MSLLLSQHTYSCWILFVKQKCVKLLITVLTLLHVQASSCSSSYKNQHLPVTQGSSHCSSSSSSCLWPELRSRHTISSSPSFPGTEQKKDYSNSEYSSSHCCYHWSCCSSGLISWGWRCDAQQTFTVPSLLRSNRQRAQDSPETGSEENDSRAVGGDNIPSTHALRNRRPCCSVRCRAWMHLFWHNEISVLHRTHRRFAHAASPEVCWSWFTLRCEKTLKWRDTTK